MPFNSLIAAISVLLAGVSTIYGAKPLAASFPKSVITTFTFPLPTKILELDQKKVHGVYSEGDFDLVVSMIDVFTRSNPTCSKSDSVFIAKHLAVIYTANPATREMGKNYMFKLLDLLPSAKIVD